MHGNLCIEIELPEKRGSSFGRYKPKGRVVVSWAGRTETLMVPVQVARHLKKLDENGELEAGSRDELDRIIAEVSEECAWKRLVGLIDMRDYSTLEADEKLKLDGYAEGIRKAAIERATGCFLLNDERYGEFFVRAKIGAGWGRERIQRELERKGIGIDTVPGWPDEFFSDEGDYERARAIIARKHLTGKNDFQKLMRVLSSKGYSSSIAYRAVSDLLDETRDGG